MLSTSNQREIDDQLLNTTNKNDTEGDSENWFGNENINENDLDLKEKGNNVDKEDLEEEYSKTEKEASPEVAKKELK